MKTKPHHIRGCFALDSSYIAYKVSKQDTQRLRPRKTDRLTRKETDSETGYTKRNKERRFREKE